MKGFIFTITFFAVIIAVPIAGAWIVFKILDKIADRRDAERKREHPELYRLFDEVNEKCGECCRWHNKNIVPLKKEIDRILADWNYYTDARREQKEAELKRLREELQVAEAMHNALNSELVELREQTRDYVSAHDLEWARKWGW
jgi:uncharacterized coiled-coil DUF342 family protein